MFTDWGDWDSPRVDPILSVFTSKVSCNRRKREILMCNIIYILCAITHSISQLSPREKKVKRDVRRRWKLVVALVSSCNQWRLYIAVMPRPVNEKVIIFHSVPSSSSFPIRPKFPQRERNTLCVHAQRTIPYKASTAWVYKACKLGKYIYDTRFIPSLPKSFAKPTVNPKLNGNRSEIDDIRENVNLK